MFKVELTGNQKKALLDEYSFLPIFADVVEGLSSLKEVGYALYAFSNGSRMAISRLLTNAGIMDRFDVIGAIAYGMKSAWLQRAQEIIFDPWEFEPTLTINRLTELAPKLEQMIT